MLNILIFAIISLIMLIIAYNIANTRKEEEKLDIAQFVEQMNRDKTIITIFMLFTYFGGEMLFHPSKRKDIGYVISYNISFFLFVILMTGGFSHSAGLTKSGEGVVGIIIISFVVIFRIIMLIKSFGSMKDYMDKHKNQLELKEKQKEKEKQRLELHKIEEEKKYSSDKFILEIQNNYKLYNNDILTKDEYESRIKKILYCLNEYGINEEPEDFITNILILKENGIINKELLFKIKNIIIRDII